MSLLARLANLESRFRGKAVFLHLLQRSVHSEVGNPPPPLDTRELISTTAIILEITIQDAHREETDRFLRLREVDDGLMLVIR